jgi:hypothetical protein
VRVVAVFLLALAVTAPALGADGEPRKALTAKGQAIAKAVVLKRSDLSAGFVGHAATDDPLPKGARCDSVDESDLTVTGDASSPNFSRDTAGIAVGSSASVYRSRSESNAAWRRAGTAAAVRCFADLVRLTSPAPRKVRIVSAKRIPFPKVAPNAIAYRVVASVSVGSRTVKAYFDAILLRNGTVPSGSTRNGRSRASSPRAWRRRRRPAGWWPSPCRGRLSVRATVRLPTRVVASARGRSRHRPSLPTSP